MTGSLLEGGGICGGDSSHSDEGKKGRKQAGLRAVSGSGACPCGMVRKRTGGVVSQFVVNRGGVYGKVSSQY